MLEVASHVSVLLDDVVRALVPEPWDQEETSFWLDGTLGLAGHATAILMEAGPKSRLLGLDKDKQARAEAALRLGKFQGRVQIEAAGFEGMAAPGRNFLGDAEGYDGILLDLGVSSLQLDDAERGFSFSKDAPLDMRMDQNSGPTAAQWLASQDELGLKRVLKAYGEEPRAGAIARSILRAMPVTTTRGLADAVLRASGPRKPGGAHPATRSFQAIRIAVNRELESLDLALPQALKLLKRGGRLAVISFHSLEDRRVKEFIVKESTDCVCPPAFPVCRCGHKASLAKVLRKAVVASEAEIARNPRSRSARLRVAEKL
jgi:16S rRNA (cytosine1402-N4)-methyltransferase